MRLVETSRLASVSLSVCCIALLPCVQALIGLCDELEVVSGLGLPPHWATNFFLAGLCLELQANAEALSRLQLINQVEIGSRGTGCGQARQGAHTHT